jgi:hypothetical protein
LKKFVNIVYPTHFDFNFLIHTSDTIFEKNFGPKKVNIKEKFNQHIELKGLQYFYKPLLLLLMAQLASGKKCHKIAPVCPKLGLVSEVWEKYGRPDELILSPYEVT